MSDFFETSVFAGVTVSLIAYFVGMFLKKKLKLAIFNPLLVSIIFTIIVLVMSKVDYKVYNEGAKYLSWFLTPATVCLAIPLHEQWQLLKKNYKAVRSINQSVDGFCFISCYEFGSCPICNTTS